MERTTLIFWPLKFKRLIGRCTDQPANEKVLWRALLKSNAEEVAEKQDLLASFGLFWRFFSPASTASSRSSPDTGGLRLGSAMVIVHAACSIRRFFNNIPGLFVKFPTSTVRLIVAFGPRLRPALRFGCLTRPSATITGHRLFVKARFGQKNCKPLAYSVPEKRLAPGSTLPSAILPRYGLRRVSRFRTPLRRSRVYPTASARRCTQMQHRAECPATATHVDFLNPWPLSRRNQIRRSGERPTFCLTLGMRTF